MSKTYMVPVRLWMAVNADSTEEALEKVDDHLHFAGVYIDTSTFTCGEPKQVNEADLPLLRQVILEMTRGGEQ